MRIKALVALTLLLAMSAAAGLVIRHWWADGPLGKPVEVIIPGGATLTSAAAELERSGAIRSSDWFLALAKLFGSGDPVRAGEFELPALASGADALDILQHGKPLRRLITVTEGMPSILVHERLMTNPLLTGPAPVPAEGSVLPDSYDYQRGEPRAAVLKRMQDAMTSTLDTLWAGRKPGIAVASKAEAVTLASIVEKETAKPSERRMVAGVYSNRLRQGMKLDADPTVIYPITRGKPLGRRILRSELRDDNGYNTYARAGLPPGPIANPGRASIAAVLDPAPTRALFFVADGTGGHVFAERLAEHEANRRKWYAIRRARGEM